MMKIIGCILITLSCMGFGVLLVTSQYQRRKCVSSIILALRYIETEIMSTNMPLPEIFEKLAESGDLAIRPLFYELCKGYKNNTSATLYPIWENAIKNCKEVSLSDYQKSELLELGKFLGQYSSEEQRDAIDICITRLEMQLEMMNKRIHKSRRLYPGLGLSIGLMLSIALV